MKKRFRTQNAVILIDAGYLSHISKHLGGGNQPKYRIQDLCINLCKKKSLWCEGIYYYTAPPFQSNPPTEDEARRKGGYDTFIRKLSSGNPATWVREGRLQKINNQILQKGVDTWLVFDLLKISQRKEYSTIIILTADTDFAEIIKEIIKDYGTRIILAYYTDKIRGSPFTLSNFLWQACPEKIIIEKKDFT